MLTAPLVACAAALVEIAGTPATVILVLPLLLLAGVVAYVAWPRHSRAAHPPVKPLSVMSPPPARASEDLPSEDKPRDAAPRSSDVLPAVGVAHTAEEPDVPSRAVPSPSPEARTPMTPLDSAAPETAEDYLHQARAEIARGNGDVAAEHLRTCIRIAVRARNKAAEAEARLELAELARAAGDLTTACEHWQIARAAFHAIGVAPALAETEELMRRHGCPTDWVLNDF